MTIELNLKPETADAAYELFSWISGRVVDAARETALFVKDFIFSEKDIDPKLLAEWQKGLPRPQVEPRVRTYHERMRPPTNWTPPPPNLIPDMIEKGWLDESSKHLGHDSLTNRVALLLFKDGDGWSIPQNTSERS